MTINYYLDKPQDRIKAALQKETAIYLFIRGGRVKYLNKAGEEKERAGTIRFHIGERIHPKHWDHDKQQVKSSYTGSPEFNNYLTTIKAEVQTALMKHNSGKPRSLADVEPIVAAIIAGREYTQPTQSFNEVYASFLAAYESDKSKGTIDKQARNLVLLQAFVNNPALSPIKRKDKPGTIAVINKPLTFEGITVEFIERWVAYLLKHADFTNNTAAKAVTLLNTFLNWATARGYNSSTDYQKYKSGSLSKDTDVIALTETELMKLYRMDLSGNDKLARVRDVFCFGCFTGQRFSDVSGLKPEHVRGDVWYLRVQKTTEVNKVPLNDFALAILNKYPDSKLPSISNQKSNDYVKELGRLAEINEPITTTRFRGSAKIERLEPKCEFIGTHTARRTFATLSLEKGMRPETVMRIGGWKDYKTFKKYIRLTDKSTAVEMRAIWSESSQVLMKAV